MAQPTAANNETEDDLYHPSAEVVSAAHIQDYDTLYQRSMEDPEGFWADLAEALDQDDRGWNRK